jgi:hypothetical protein
VPYRQPVAVAPFSPDQVQKGYKVPKDVGEISIP